MLRFTLLTMLALSSFSLIGHAQSVSEIDLVQYSFERFSALQSPEKVYLHTDKQFYCAGEYIWFNAYLKNSSDYSLMPESGYVYAELIDKDTVLSRVMIKRCDEGFPGRMPLPTDLSSGKYTLRAYTAWMQSFSEEYMFHKEITIINPSDERDDALTTLFDGDDTLFEIQFLPESGRYIPDDIAVLAFKAVNTAGRGVAVTGAVYDSRDSMVVSFSDRYKGMGKLEFYPIRDEHYYAVVVSEQGVEIKQSLPALSEAGAVIHISAQGGKREIRAVVSEPLLSRPLFVVLSNGSELYLCNRMTGREYKMELEEAWLSSGINHATIVDEKGNVFAQRIFFVYPSDIIEAEILADKTEPDSREKITYTIQILDKLQVGVQSTFSLSVTDKYLVPHNASDHLLSYMLLSSELNGAIEDAAALFDPSWKERDEAIDLVMMTHGWRYYDMPAIFSSTTFGSLPKKEYSQTISGKVSSLFKRVSESNIIVYAPEINLSYAEQMDRSGRFQIKDLDFPDSTQFVFSATGKRGSREYYLEIDRPTFPTVTSYRFISDRTALSGERFEDVIGEYALSYKVEKDDTSILLEEAVVTASQSFVKPTINPSPFNQYFETRQLRERKQLAKFDGMFLSDYLVTSFGSLMNGGERIVNRAGFSLTGTNEPVVYIDHVKMDSTDLLNRLYVGDIENVVVLRPAEAGALYNSPGGVILVSMRRSYSKGEIKNINTRLVTPLGWQKPTRFYSPNYSLRQDRDAINYDNRTTLYWNPFVQTDENGVAEISFYTSDRKTEYNFSIEGLTNEGEYISVLL